MAAPFQLYPSSLSSATNSQKLQKIETSEALSLISKCNRAIKSVESGIVDQARELCTRAGLPVESEMSMLLRHKRNDNSFASALTAGHSNTNHVITWTGDYTTDRIAELRRNLMARARYQQPEARGEERWDKPKMPGERRRRIVRSKDLPGAPPEPPQSGYIIFLGQMTTKLRHDRPNERHSQAQVIQEISKMWRLSLTEEERNYYLDFVEEIRKECKKQHMEYRATGVHTPSEVFERPEGAGLWVHSRMEDKNELEKEIAGYETVHFPLRPPEYDEEYKKREEESKLKRKLKLQREWEEKRKQGKTTRKRRVRKEKVVEES